MTAIAWLLWAAIVWAVFLAFAIIDVPELLGRAAGHVHLPHWVHIRQHVRLPGRHVHRSER